MLCQSAEREQVFRGLSGRGEVGVLLWSRWALDWEARGFSLEELNASHGHLDTFLETSGLAMLFLFWCRRTISVMAMSFLAAGVTSRDPCFDTSKSWASLSRSPWWNATFFVWFHVPCSFCSGILGVFMKL